MRDFWYSFTVVFIAFAVIFGIVYMGYTVKYPTKTSEKSNVQRIYAVVVPVNESENPKTVACKLCGFKTRYVVEYCPHCAGRQNG